MHAEEFLYSYFQRDRELPASPAEIDAMVKRIAIKIASSGTWVSPTLAVFREIVYQVADIDSVLERPAMRYLPAAVVADWQPARNSYVQRWKIEKVPYFRAQYRIMQKLTKGLQDAGARLLVGTDSMSSGVIPGFSMQDELDDLVGAGLTPYQALRAATINAANFLNIAGAYGAVSVGKRADLILLNANPLDDISSVSRRAGVMLKGRWLTEDELQRGLASLAEAYRN